MSEVCRYEGCGGDVSLTYRGPNVCKRCMTCGKRQHDKIWLSKTEAGLAPRSTQTVHAAIKPKLRAKVIDRSGGRCEMCGATNVLFHVGHFVSVDAGLAAGMTDEEINSEENLYCSCEECNLGMGAMPVSIRTLMAIIRGRLVRSC
jgi:5-methylcytosine-specific restriction endonuclease McrA